MPADASPILSAVLVDDEEPARRVLREYLAEHADVAVAAECANGFEAVKAVAEHRPDLLFLDIQMPKLSGFEVLELLDEEPAVIFATAHDEHAVRAFEIHAVDYLLKPFGPERLAEALRRARARLASGDRESVRSLSRLGRTPGRPLDRILIKDDARIHVLPVERIDWIEARDDDVLVRADGASHRKSEALSDLEAELDPQRFVRIHRSYLLNVERLARIELYAKDSRVAILRDGTRLPVSRAGYARLKELL
ncbi:MAG TPA: response regulator [Thermoanaerobaculia bacterium]|nr:response regulator [Thermoanaerobaculia bacterium]